MSEQRSSSIAPSRVIRVFVSSTFLDMYAEREELIKRVFPQLRKLCAERGVTWSEVDLRWGITDEQSADDQIIPICLREIDQCHPFFIGLLGERYGWVPDGFPPELVGQEAWLAECQGRSATELEILHGALNNPPLAGHAYFYFRNPAYVDGQPESERANIANCLGRARLRFSGLQRRSSVPKRADKICLR